MKTPNERGGAKKHLDCKTKHKGTLHLWNGRPHLGLEESKQDVTRDEMWRLLLFHAAALVQHAARHLERTLAVHLRASTKA